MRYELREGEDLWHPANICDRGKSNDELCGKAGEEVTGREGGAGSCGEGRAHSPWAIGNGSRDNASLEVLRVDTENLED